MSGTKANSGLAPDLRRRAEELANAKFAQPLENNEALSPEAARKALYDLQVHQIELEMQNEELRRTQMELEASRERYFDLYDLAPVGYFTLNEQGLILEANLTAASLLGVERSTLVRQPLTRFIPPEDQDIFYLHRKQLFESSAPQVCEFRMLRADAAPFWARIEAAAAQDANGAPVCRAVMSDITERKWNEEFLEFLAHRDSSISSRSFFESLAQYLAKNLGMDFVCIDRLEGDGLNARTVAVWCDGKFEDNVVYALKDTPCGDVVGKSVCSFPASVCQFFPRDQVLRELRAESYVGVTLWGHTNQPIGLIAVIGRSALANRSLAEATLKMVAVRAAGEMERLTVEETLRASEEHYRGLFEHMSEGYAYCKVIFEDGRAQDWIYLTVNDAFETLTGLKNVAGKRVSEVIPGIRESNPELFEAYARVATTRKPEKFEVFVKALEMWFAVSVYSPGKGYFVAVFDVITERKQAEASLRERERTWATLISNLPGFVYRCANDRDWTMQYISDGCRKITGYAPDDFLQNGTLAYNDIVHPDYQEPLWQRWQEILAKRETFEEEYPIRNAGGDERWVWERGQGIYAEDGQLLYLEGFITDITERKRAEEAQRKSEERFRALIEHSHDAITLLTADGTVLYDSPSIASVLGYGPAERIGRSVFEFAHPEQRESMANGFAEFARRIGAVAQSEVCFIHKDGTPRWIEGVRANLLNEPSVRAVVVNYRDITERKRMEAEKSALEAQNWQLQKAESLGRMAGAIAHHFNNQLQAVTGYLELAMRKLPPNEDAFQMLVEAMQAARNAAKMSSSMLTYLGLTYAEHERLDICETCRQSLSVLQVAIPKNVNLKIDFASPGPTVDANANQIQQILANLLINAWEAIGAEAGEIRLSVKTVSPADIPASPRFPLGWQAQDKAYACLEVADTGCGIEKKNIEKIFDPFFTTKFTGRGMGLPVALGIAKASEGAVTVASEPDRGSAFRVFLPVSAAQVSDDKIKRENR